MSELLFGFRDLTNVTDPSKSIINLSSFILSDTFVRKFNPKRYSFYVKFLSGLSNPANLYKFLYKTHESKVYHDDLVNKIKLISKSLHLLSENDRKKVIENLKLVLLNKDDDDKNGKYAAIIKYIETLNKDKSSINGGKKKKGGDGFYINKNLMPMKSFIDDIKETFPGIATVPANDINDLIKNNTNTASEQPRQPKPVDINVNNLKGVYEKYKSISQISPEKININFADRGVFILTTYVLRLLTLSLIYWCLNSNIINNFKTAFIYYCIIYILFFLFLIGIVNVIYYYPVVELFSNVSLVSIPNLLYYFYIHINGMNRLILHMVIILILLVIPFILSLDDIQNNDNTDNISFDNVRKNKIYTTISNFSLVVWMLTSVVALKF
jgi:hypothetical protein